MAETTTSGAQSFPTATITVVASGTTGFATSGTVYVFNASGIQTVAYTGTTTNTFTGCTGGTGAIASGSGVLQSTEQNTTSYLDGEKQITSAIATGFIATKTGTYLYQNSMTSTDQLTATIFGEKKVTQASGTGFIGTKTGSYNTQIGFDYPNDRGTDFSSSSMDKSPIPSPLPLASGALTKYYKMVGYYVTGATYEDFISIGAPSASTAVNPNTGHTLINCYVSTFWQQ